jgi:hypothetical protein
MAGSSVGSTATRVIARRARAAAERAERIEEALENHTATLDEDVADTLNWLKYGAPRA